MSATSTGSWEVLKKSGPYSHSGFSTRSEAEVPLEGISTGFIFQGQCFHSSAQTRENECGPHDSEQTVSKIELVLTSKIAQP